MTDQFRFDNPIVPGSIWDKESNFNVPVISPVGNGPKGDKGDKGDPFTYRDFTKKQLDELSGKVASVGNKSEDAYFTTTLASTTTIPIPIADFDDFDLLFVDVEGLDLAENVDYTIQGSNIVLAQPITHTGVKVHFRALSYEIPSGDKTIMNIMGRKDYNTVAEMQADENLEAGDICHTLGFHAAGDGGAAWYKIKTFDTEDNINCFKLANGKFATQSGEKKADKNNAFNSDDYGNQLDSDYQRYTYPNLINWGQLKEAPYIKCTQNKSVDFLAHWYNDFGLQRTALAPNMEQGNYKWYDWSWNFPSLQTYDEAREPLFGDYPGDNATVLDWVCYWLIQSGVTGVVFPNQINNITNWSDPANYNYWYYVLFNQVKNFNTLKYVLPIGFTTSEIAINAIDNIVLNILERYPHPYVYTYNGKKYCTVYCWDMQLIRGVFDNYSGITNTLAHFRSLTESIKTLGYDGMLILGRNTGSAWNDYLGFDNGEDFAILTSEYSHLYYNGEVPSPWGTDVQIEYNYSYENYVNNVVLPNSKTQCLNLITSLESSTAHPSTYNMNGSTPDLFAKLVNKTISQIEANNMHPICTIYNVSEWAEGGPGLIPNKKDGFGYLNAISQAASENKSIIDIDDLKNTFINEVFSNNKNFFRNSALFTIARGESKTIEVSLNNLYDYRDSLLQYAVIPSVVTTTPTYGLRWGCSVNFGTKRCYFKLHVDDDTYEEAYEGTVSLLIIKK